MRTPNCGLALILGSLVITPCAGLADNSAAAIPSRADPALVRFVQTVVDMNPRVQAAQSALHVSDSLKNAASRPLYNPLLSLDAENADIDSRSIGISQTLDWTGKRNARTSVAEFERQAAKAEYLSTRWAVTVELLGGLALHQTGIDREALANSRRLLMRDFADLAQRRYTAGDLSEVEVALANLAATQARIEKATAGAKLAEARQTVRNVASRVPVKQWPLLPDDMPDLSLEDFDPQALVLTLPNVAAVRSQAQSANAMVDLRRLERKPDPTISLAGGEADGETLIGINLSIPLFVRNRFDYEVSAAVAQQSQAQQLAHDVTQRAQARLISAGERYELSRGAWEDWKLTGQTSLSQQADQLQRLWEAGELSTTEYLVQLRQTLDVKESALNLRQALWRAWFEWLWASGQMGSWLGEAEIR